MKITPLDIQQQQFKKRGGRYEAAEVDAFLEMVRLEMEELTRVCTAQSEEVKRLESELSELRGQEKLLKEAILTTQKVSEEIKNQAQKSAEIILAEAKLKADQIFDEARGNVQRLNDEISDLRVQRIGLEASFRSMLDAHMKMLEATVEDAEMSDEEAAKVKVIGR
jgi:cell division initiation protein